MYSYDYLEPEICDILCRKNSEKIQEEIRCMQADLVVVIGSGANVKGYSSSATLLSFLSSKLDDVISTND